MSNFWSLWIIVITVGSLIGLLWLLLANRKIDSTKADQKTGHEYDGIEEYDNPLPAWWMNMFLLSIVFAAIYLIAYPGLGNFKGLLGWTQEKQWQAEVTKADAQFLAMYNSFPELTVAGLAGEEQAVKMGKRLFANNCAICHGSDAGGSKGYPNLTNGVWLYGGSPEQIYTSINDGRRGAMPPWGESLGEENVKLVSNYVRDLGANQAQADANTQGKTIYATYCAACHGGSGEGNIYLGAPNLADDVWLYGGSDAEIFESISLGRSGEMPAHKDLLSPEKVNLLAAYVYSLSK